MSLTMAESPQQTLPAFQQQVPRISAFSTWQTEGWKGQVHASPPPPAHAPAPHTCLSCLLHTWRCYTMHLSLAHMAMLRNAPVFLVSCIHGGCYAMHVCFLSLAHMVDATQCTYLSCLWHTWWMLRNPRVLLVSCAHGGSYGMQASLLFGGMVDALYCDFAFWCILLMEFFTCQLFLTFCIATFTSQRVVHILSVLKSNDTNRGSSHALDSPLSVSPCRLF